jgi:hypothetical protein
MQRNEVQHDRADDLEHAEPGTESTSNSSDDSTCSTAGEEPEG